MINKTLVHSSYCGVNIYRIKSKIHDFQIEKLMANGDLNIHRTSDNSKLTKLLVNSGLAADRLQALDLLNCKSSHE